MTRSVRIHEFGGPEVLRIEDVPVADPGGGEVRLRVQAIGLNRTEITLRSGRSPIKPPLPTGLGFEAAGVIDAVGPDVRDFQVGERVALVPAYGAAQYPLYGEFSLAPARSLVHIPPSLNFVQAAAVWAAFATAWCGLVVVGRLRPGQSVVVPAASSGVGLAAIQVANRLGARAIAMTRDTGKVEPLRAAGAAAVVVSAGEGIVDRIKHVTGGRGADLVFDPVGGPAFANLARGVANGGTLVLYGALASEPTEIPPFDIFARDLTVRGLALSAYMRDDRTMRDMRAFVEPGLVDGSLRPTIAKVFPFERIADAHRFVEAGEQIGKVVVTL